MIVPTKIYIEVYSDDKVNLTGIILDIKVKAGRKNPYYITTPKTNNQGKAILTKAELKGQFEDYWERALMDYDGNLDVAESVVEVSLWDPTWYRENKSKHFAWDLLKNEQKRWKSREEEYSYKISCRNEKFKATPIKVDLEKTDTIRLKVKKR